MSDELKKTLDEILAEYFIAENGKYFSDGVKAVFAFVEEALLKQNQELKEAAEMEFQKADGKNEMKRWFQERINFLQEQNHDFREALEKIVHEDTSQSEHWHIAKSVLSKHNQPKEGDGK